VIGDVVRLRKELSWIESKPLFGKKIMITRPEEQMSDIKKLLNDAGAEVIKFPLIKIMPPHRYRFVDDAVKNLKNYDWIIFTSVNGAKYFFRRFFKYFNDIREFGRTKICAIGSTTERIIKDYNLDVEFRPEKYTSEALVKKFSEMKRLKGKKVLLPRANIAGEYLAEELKKLGAIVDEIATYRTVELREYNPEYIEMLKNDKIDLITFTSTSTVKSFVNMAKKNNMLDIIPGLKTVSIGPETTKTARKYGFNIEAEADVHNIRGLFNVIIKTIS